MALEGTRCKGRRRLYCDNARYKEVPKEYPQQNGQKAGYGFPIMRCVMLFCLATGAAMEIAMGRYRGKQTGELSLFQAINHLVFPGDIQLADRYYATFVTIYQAISGGYLFPAELWS